MILSGVGAMMLAACGPGQQAPVPSGPPVSITVAGFTGVSTRGAQLVGRCQACHALVAGGGGIGPTLYGVIGRRAGTVAGYPYSAANKASGWQWDAATMHRYLAAPTQVMPGTKMAYAVGDAQDRADIVAYLSTLH